MILAAGLFAVSLAGCDSGQTKPTSPVAVEEQTTPLVAATPTPILTPTPSPTPKPTPLTQRKIVRSMTATSSKTDKQIAQAQNAVLNK